jgi:PAS domain S-box-containing protein
MNKQSNPPPNRSWKIIQFLIEPPPGITDLQQKRQVRLLSSLLLIIILFGSISGILQLLAVPGFFPIFVSIAGAAAFLGVSYILTRTKHYLAAAVITTLTPFVASYTALLTNTRDQSSFVFLLVSVLLSSILLNQRLTVGMAILNVIGLILLPYIQPEWTSSVVAGKISFHLIISVLIVISMRHRDLLESDRQEELRASELKFRSIFDNSLDAIGVSKAGTHIMANPAYVQMFGCESAGQLAGRSILDLIAPSERAKIQENVRRRLAGEQVPMAYETRGLRCDGTEFDMDVNVSAYELGGELYTVAILQDITQRKQTEDALRASEIRYRAIVESTTDLICRFLPDTTLTFVNETYCRYFGQSRERLIGTRFLNLIPEEEWESVQSHVNSIIRNRKPFTYSHEVFTPSGEIRWQQWTDSTILNENGEVVELQSVGRDITEQKAAEEELVQFKSTLDQTQDCVFMFTRDALEFFYVNQGAIDQVGYTEEELFRMHPYDIKPEFPEPQFRALIQPLLDQTLPNLRFETIHRHRDGHHIPVEVFLQYIALTGKKGRFVAIVRDITEHKLAEAEREKFIGELEAKNAELERFTYTVSHDLKSPLVTIKGFLGFLEQDIASGNSKRIQDDIWRINNAVLRMEQLLRELLELSRIGRLTNPSENIHFEELVSEAMEIVHGQLEAHRVTVHIQPDLPAVYGDRQRLTEVLQNLLDNAAKYMGDQADPQIEIGRRGEDAEHGQPIFFIKDNGIGIAPEHHERIFGLFNKLDMGSEGTGIGLALVKRIIEFHGGRIWVESETGKGSTFLFTLHTGPPSLIPL